MDTIVSVTLLIIAKANWKGAFCYLGYEPIAKRILRPVIFKPGLPPENAICPVPRNPPLEVGVWCQFDLELPSLMTEAYKATLPPHRFDDIIVKPSFKTLYHYPSNLFIQQSFSYTQQPSPMYEILQPLSKDKIEDIFNPSYVFNNKYVNVGTICPSVGVLQCRRSQLWIFFEPDHKLRIVISCCNSGVHTIYQFPFTADNKMEMAHFINSLNDLDETVLILFSTGRPLSGYPPEKIFDPPRCYMLVVGLVRQYLSKSFHPAQPGFVFHPPLKPFHSGRLPQPVQHGQNKPQFYSGPLQQGQNQPQFYSGPLQQGQNQPQFYSGPLQQGQNQPQFYSGPLQQGQNQPQFYSGPLQQGQNQPQFYSGPLLQGKNHPQFYSGPLLHGQNHPQIHSGHITQPVQLESQFQTPFHSGQLVQPVPLQHGQTQPQFHSGQLSHPISRRYYKPLGHSEELSQQTQHGRNQPHFHSGPSLQPIPVQHGQNQPQFHSGQLSHFISRRHRGPQF